MKSYEFTAVNILQKYHFSREDAEAFLETIKEAKSEDNATKGDIKMVQADIKKIEERILIIERDIKAIESRLEVKIQESKLDIIKWVLLFLAGQTAIILGVIKFYK